MATARPIRCAIGKTVFLASSWAIPLADGSCRSIACLDVLELVRDDEALVAEFGRLLAPGGHLRLRVPNTGLLAGVDGFNLYHYLVDTTHRRRKPPETEEVGWRRHYGVPDVVALLGPRFCIRTVSARRAGVAEFVNAVLLVLLRWLLGSDGAYRRSMPVVRRVERLEDRFGLGRIGAVLTIEAVKRADLT
ncbi:MAG TPA: methyltransferase domain-containing protein [Thermomicrobiales bacterium]